ncbi:uncharacterized protein DSM5745_11158 [Aspergillus mulundensis]|uniref:Uncharacterized protein n=1 Tax=Aspergillus mulundensis TaxID=1810919 RepID=A0A3D8QAS5_9EURO|nr:hypothetical protein DSM5745_11158 [Aspergillus mulundensis]RDW58952.1 hypothetical protein DSM5745_11158 [Aspergillus mulundensis]
MNLATPPVEVDSKGDLVIICSGIPLLVTKSALSLSPRLYELCAIGNDSSLRRGEAQSPQPTQHVPTPIYVAEEPYIFLLFLNVLHHNTNARPRSLDAVAWTSLSALVDKYICRVALLDEGRREWLQPSLQHGLKAEDVWRLLRFAYNLGLQEGMSGVSRTIVQMRSEPFTTWDFAKNNLGDMPRAILDHLDRCQGVLFSRTIQALSSVTTTMAVSRCASAQAYIGKYIQELAAKGILPETRAFREKTYLQVVGEARRIPEEIYINSKCGRNGPECECVKHIGFAQKQHLLRQLARCLDTNNVVLCLRCLGDTECEAHR